MSLTEAAHAFSFLLSEAEGQRSRDKATLLSGQNLVAGAVLGKTVTAGTVTGAAQAGNTGTGTIGTLSAGGGAKEGVYRAVCVEPATDLGKFVVIDPDGVNVGVATVGSAFSGAVVFTIADGGTDFVSGDAFNITVSQLTVKYKVLNPSGTDGSQFAAGILGSAVDASAADTPCAVVSRDAEANSNELTWPGGITAAQKSIATAQLAALGILIR